MTAPLVRSVFFTPNILRPRVLCFEITTIPIFALAPTHRIASYRDALFVAPPNVFWPYRAVAISTVARSGPMENA
jgi:hypothetical protein